MAALDGSEVSLARVGVQLTQGELISLVRQLRERLSSRLDPETRLWGVKLLDGEDAAATHILAKFVRGRDANLDDAEAMVHQTIEWRAKYGTDSILDDHSIPEILTRIAYIAGKARSGHPVLYFEYGPLNDQETWDAAFSSTQNIADSPLIRSRIKLLETGIRSFDFSKGLDEPTGFVLVHDLRDAPLVRSESSVLMSTDASNGMIHMIKVANEYYPDFSVRHVFLYAPTLMSTVLSAVKPFLSNRTQKKLIWAPSGDELTTLLQMISMNNIPARFGGFLGIPYPTEAQVQEVEVPAGKTVPITLRNMGPGSEARWAVSLAERDVTVRVEFTPLGADKRDPPVLVEEKEVVIGDSVEGGGTFNGRYQCTEAGFVRVTLDNLSSWVTAKHVFLATSVTDGKVTAALMPPKRTPSRTGAKAGEEQQQQAGAAGAAGGAGAGEGAGGAPATTAAAEASGGDAGAAASSAMAE